MPRATIVIAVALALAIGLAPGCSGSAEPRAAQAGAGRQPTSFPVEVVEVRPREVTYTVQAVGAVEAFERVAVTARVAGVVERVRFQEGAEVRAGQTLVEIEPDRYRASVQAAEARVARARAARQEAEAGLARRRQLDSEGLIAAEDLDTWATRVDVAAAELAEAQAALRQTRLSLRDSQVAAPISGRIETRSVETGQYVEPGTVLGELVRREPLLLRLRVPEQEATRLVEGEPARFRVGDEPHLWQATITHVAGYADPASRMVTVTARIDDPGRASLRPGAFARVEIPVGRTGSTLVVPQTAVRPSERGFLAYVVGAGEVASERVVSLGLRTEDGQVEVREGLAAGERLVVRGAEALRDGVTVRIVPAGSGEPGMPDADAAS